MASKQVLKDLQGGTIYPVTDISCVYNAPNVKCEEYMGDVERITGVTREELKKDLFIDLWNDACKIESKTYGKYNEETGFFELNGITDIPYDEAIFIYNMKWPSVTTAYYAVNQGYANTLPLSKPVRTLFPVYGSLMYSLTNYFSGMFWGFNYPLYLAVDSPRENGMKVLNMSHTFQNNRSMREVKGKIDVSSITSFNGTFENCSDLREFDFYGLKADLKLGGSNNLSLNSLTLLVTQALNTAPITVTVGPRVYEKLTGAVEDSEEWMALNELALEKNILFASA